MVICLVPNENDAPVDPVRHASERKIRDLSVIREAYHHKF
jgi:hypothetical protein